MLKFIVILIASFVILGFVGMFVPALHGGWGWIALAGTVFGLHKAI